MTVVQGGGSREFLGESQTMGSLFHHQTAKQRVIDAVNFIAKAGASCVATA